MVGDVFNMKRSLYDFNFCLLCVKIYLVDNRTSFNKKNPSYLILPCHDFHLLVVSGDLNGMEPIVCIFKLKTSQLS
jgi:hypothetical protein